MSNAASSEVTCAQPRSSAEWVSLGVALVLLAAIVAALVGIWSTSPEAPPRFRIELGDATEQSGVFYLPITLANEGDIAATEVRVEGTVLSITPPETATTTFDVVPGHAEVEAVLVFTRNPRQAQVRVVSHQHN
jgi:uncharacterized protein (TIGR02588 family)